MKSKARPHTITFNVKATGNSAKNAKRYAQITFLFEADNKWHHHQTFFSTANNPYNYADFMFLREVANAMEQTKLKLNNEVN